MRLSINRLRLSINCAYPLRLNFQVFKEPRNRFHGIDSASLYVCSLAGQYDNPISARFLALLDISKITAQREARGLGESTPWNRFLGS